MSERKGLFRSSLMLSVLAALALPLAAQTPADQGPVAAETPQTASIIFNLRNPSGLEAFIAQSVSPGWGYRQFLSTHEFAERFAPSESDFRQVVGFLKQQGLTVDEVYDSHMVIRATGTTAQFNALLSTELHQYRHNGRQYQKPATPPRMPEEIQNIVLMVAGMDTEVFAQAHHTSNAKLTAHGVPAPALVMPQAGATATGVPGNFTVGDVANLYNINPLYQLHVTGKGQTLGIATLASFSQADAYAYWSAVGLKVAPDRITEIPIDGGSGSNGADETTLDVEQSGGVAYGAKILVYEAPNTYSGFLDLFYRAVSDNKVDTLSTSWGSPEIELDQDTLTAYHQAFLEAAAQGIPVFASAGDQGAFDFNGDAPTPFWAPVNSVDNPACDPYVTAAGGLTLPFTIPGTVPLISVPALRPWGWDYLENYVVSNANLFTYLDEFFPVGGGGGVSVSWTVPAWQRNLAGVQLSPADDSNALFYPNYTATDADTSGAISYGTLPVGFNGRNVPDLSLNADPNTGYLTYFHGAFQNGWGGTSFVAPQLNGIAALITQAAGGRLGCLNPQIYRLFRHVGYRYDSPFNAVTSGTNLYWGATPTYNPASGLGSIDATRFAFDLLGY